MAIVTTSKNRKAPHPPSSPNRAAGSKRPKWVAWIVSIPSRVQKFFHEVGQELRKSIWPSRDELKESTAVVILSVLLVAFWVWVCDLVFQFIVQRMI